MPSIRFFQKEPRKGMPVSMMGLADGLRRIAYALENMEVQGGYVDWSGDIPKIVFDFEPPDPDQYGVSDHGELTGLEDDDHSQYFLLSGRSGTGNDITVAVKITDTTSTGDGVGALIVAGGVYAGGGITTDDYIDIQSVGEYRHLGLAGYTGGQVSGGIVIAQLDHVDLLNIGTNTHAQIDDHIADSTIHFTEGSIDHNNLSGLQGGSAGEYYHLTSAEYSTLQANDHGSLNGLDGDDHPQYFKLDGRTGTANDITAPVTITDTTEGGDSVGALVNYGGAYIAKKVYIADSTAAGDGVGALVITGGIYAGRGMVADDFIDIQAVGEYRHLGQVGVSGDGFSGGIKISSAAAESAVISATMFGGLL